ncbi:hypothetical protein H1D32_02650 [Anaerobacillus sp. CMMVII]|uniref:hypothetical protein n=1 Tax=Anaerobacillus sp. CMMVII TaxID=2755588 RepID=UPI0021B761BC|nr:hypothetical protein [Anaerobacillus sp. CMMVII]MCT8136748.1 hypothetical protein [Anaerobacillus sp. CMMVII]
MFNGIVFIIIIAIVTFTASKVSLEYGFNALLLSFIFFNFYLLLHINKIKKKKARNYNQLAAINWWLLFI